ncbi:MAG: response regulator [Acidobacteriaceae bacterium]|jgi:CheY-like chemotaxis protein
MDSHTGAVVQDSPRPRVLVADDERVIADTLAIILRQNGFETATAYNGREAVEAARRWKPDLLVSDVMMPELTGIEAAIQIRLLIPECKVLLFSGQTETAAMLSDARLRGYDFEILQKPVHPTDLIDRLRML